MQRAGQGAGGRVGQHQSHRAAQSKAGGATAALLGFVREQLYLRFHSRSFMLCCCYRITEHSTCPMEPQASLTILIVQLGFRQRARLP